MDYTRKTLFWASTDKKNDTVVIVYNSGFFFDVFAKTQAEKNSSSKKTQAFWLQNSRILHQNSMHRRLFCKILSKHYCCFLENWKKQQNGQVFWSKFTFFLVNWEIYLKKLKISLKNQANLKKKLKQIWKKLKDFL